MMRSTIAFTVLSLSLAHPAGALTPDGCPDLGAAAAAIMKSRQAEVPMSDVMKKLPGGDDEAVKGLFRSMVVMAYEQPSYQTPSNQERAVAEFRNQIEVLCYKNAK